MRFHKIGSSMFLVILILLLTTTSSFACMDVVVGKNATVDGSVITSHTVDGWYDANYNSRNIHVVPGQIFPEGAMLDIYYGMLGDELDPNLPVKIGEIPQAKETFTYFHDAYCHGNEFQLLISESTIGQKEELTTFVGEKAIMTIEQLTAIALQRTKTAREAIKLMGELGEKYGFLPSCAGMGESLNVSDPEEAWVFEIFSVGVGWDPKSGQSGAVWAAQRVPDDELVCVPNISRIREIDLSNQDYFMASDNYMQLAIDHGWYDQASGKPFIWQEAYTPLLGGWSLSNDWIYIRLHLVYSWAAPSQEWDPHRDTTTYPFSIKPEKKVSVMDIIELQRSTLSGTVFDMEANPAWLIPGPDGKCVKSPFATPFVDSGTRKLLNIPYYRPAAREGCSFGVVTQARNWLPDPIGGVIWFYFDNPATSIHVPIYVGVQEIPDSWSTFNRTQFSLESDRWAYMLADDLVNRRYQDAILDLREVRDPLQAKFFANQEAVEKKALELYNEDPMKAKQFLTEYTHETMDKATKAYWDLNWKLIAKYTNNTGLTP
ncbi:MAG: C69 family dipeptidase [Atribacterota bacterium]